MEKFRIYYDENLFDIVDKLNRALKQFNIQFLCDPDIDYEDDFTDFIIDVQKQKKGYNKRQAKKL